MVASLMNTPRGRSGIWDGLSHESVILILLFGYEAILSDWPEPAVTGAVGIASCLMISGSVDLLMSPGTACPQNPFLVTYSFLVLSILNCNTRSALYGRIESIRGTICPVVV